MIGSLLMVAALVAPPQPTAEQAAVICTQYGKIASISALDWQGGFNPATDPQLKPYLEDDMVQTIIVKSLTLQRAESEDDAIKLSVAFGQVVFQSCMKAVLEDK